MKNRLLLLFVLFLFTKTFSQTDSLQRLQTVLPLQIAAFDAKAINKNVQLTWTVNSNEEARSFEVVRAGDDGICRTIGGKLSTGKTGNNSYEFVDALPAKNTTLTYRIKAIAKDGTVVYSSLQPAIIEESVFDCKLRQNPVGQTIDVEIYTKATNVVSLFVFANSGQKIITETAKIYTGTNRVSISSQKLLPGLHRLVAQMGGERKVFSFVKE